MTNKPDLLTGRIINSLQKVEDLILISLFLIMIFMAVLQIFLRNLFDSGVFWGDSLVRIIGLWIGLIGAMVASRDNNHITIDIISRFLPKAVKQVTTRITSIFTSIVCGIMAWVSLRFVRFEMEDNLIAFANVPAWVCEVIIPIAFAIICIRYLFFSITGFKDTATKEENE
jgi:TRAP-type C4-dicarboxylate transport system permease small subunit